jgi:transposase InsO family protein
MAHARAKLTVHGRRLLVERITGQGWPAARAAEAQGVSLSTAYKWLRRWRAEGLAGLAGRSSRPHSMPRQLSAARQARILACRRTCRVGPHRIAAAVGEARSTVEAVLRRHGLPRLADLDRPTGQLVRRYQRATAGELLHIDVKKQGRIPDGGGHRIHGRDSAQHRARDRRHGPGWDYLHVAVDDRSRLAYVEVHADEAGSTVAGFTRRAVAWFAGLGVHVQRVMTDNHLSYRSGAFQAVLAESGVTHKRTRPYRPQTNGKAERFNQTMQREWAYARPYGGNQARLAQLPGWLHAYNTHRPHTALGGCCPMDVINNVSKNHS